MSSLAARMYGVIRHPRATYLRAIGVALVIASAIAGGLAIALV